MELIEVIPSDENLEEAADGENQSSPETQRSSVQISGRHIHKAESDYKRMDQLFLYRRHEDLPR